MSPLLSQWTPDPCLVDMERTSWRLCQNRLGLLAYWVPLRSHFGYLFWWSGRSLRLSHCSCNNPSHMRIHMSHHSLDTQRMLYTLYSLGQAPLWSYILLPFAQDIHPCILWNLPFRYIYHTKPHSEPFHRQGLQVGAWMVGLLEYCRSRWVVRTLSGLSQLIKVLYWCHDQIGLRHPWTTFPTLALYLIEMDVEDLRVAHQK